MQTTRRSFLGAVTAAAAVAACLGLGIFKKRKQRSWVLQPIEGYLYEYCLYDDRGRPADISQVRVGDRFSEAYSPSFMHDMGVTSVELPPGGIFGRDGCGVLEHDEPARPGEWTFCYTYRVWPHGRTPYENHT